MFTVDMVVDEVGAGSRIQTGWSHEVAGVVGSGPRSPYPCGCRCKVAGAVGAVVVVTGLYGGSVCSHGQGAL